MTLAVRVIPCLDVAGGRVVKGLRFENLRDAGDPVEAATRYEAEGADELTFLDIAAAHEGRGTFVHLVKRVAEVLSIPFTVGGGVRSVEDAERLLAAGAERVSLNTAAVRDPELITQISKRWGAQAVVVSVDGKRVKGPDGTTRMLVTTHGGRRTTERELASWAAEAAARGAGEILVTSVDSDGTQSGFDIEMLLAVRAATEVPLIASGGAGELAHFTRAVVEGRADAVLAASVFHDRVFTIGQVKEAMHAQGVPVRRVTALAGGGSAPPAPEPLALRFDAAGLVPVVVRDVRTGEVLTLAYADAEAIALTRRTGFSHFYSRSRLSLWKKGETSGNVQRVEGISVDCDADAVVYDVVPAGPACHTGARSCFTRVQSPDATGTLAAVKPEPSLDLGPLFAVVADRKASPVPGSYTNSLLDKGLRRIAQKVGEEGVETALAGVAEDDDALAGEAADLLYHLVVLLSARGVPASAVGEKLRTRRGPGRKA
jgi:imidazoleglycerol phosphate synthase cyclase subunit/phosphoribosyl-ATP pyrophosphohydrolase